MLVKWTNQWDDSDLNCPLWAVYEKENSMEFVRVATCKVRDGQYIWFDTDCQEIKKPKCWASIKYPKTPSERINLLPVFISPKLTEEQLDQLAKQILGEQF